METNHFPGPISGQERTISGEPVYSPVRYLEWPEIVPGKDRSPQVGTTTTTHIMDRVVKTEMREEDIEVLDNEAKEKGIPRTHHIRKILEQYLAGPGPVSPEDSGKVEVLTKALETSQRTGEVLQLEKAVLEERARGLETVLTEMKATKSYQEGLITQLMSEQNRMITDGNPGLWSRIFRGK